MLDLVGDLVQNQIVDQQRAELYMRIFRYAAEDFVNHADMEIFINALLVWAESIETRLQTLSQGLQTHTHPITPHIHPVPTHTHVIPPHFHIGYMGTPTQPTPLTTLPETPGATSANAILQTGTPQEPASLQWPQGTIPARYVNTTGTVSNIAGNKAMVGTSVIGSATPHIRRTMVIPESAVPNVPPYLVPNVV